MADGSTISGSSSSSNPIDQSQLEQEIQQQLDAPITNAQESVVSSVGDDMQAALQENLTPAQLKSVLMQEQARLNNAFPDMPQLEADIASGNTAGISQTELDVGALYSTITSDISSLKSNANGDVSPNAAGSGGNGPDSADSGAAGSKANAFFGANVQAIINNILAEVANIKNSFTATEAIAQKNLRIVTRDEVEQVAQDNITEGNLQADAYGYQATAALVKGISTAAITVGATAFKYGVLSTDAGAASFQAITSQATNISNDGTDYWMNTQLQSNAGDQGKVKAVMGMQQDIADAMKSSGQDAAQFMKDNNNQIDSLWQAREQMNAALSQAVRLAAHG